MIKTILKAALTILTLFPTICIEAETIEMATQLRSNGKIYFVVIVLLIIFLGITLFLVTIDQRIKQHLERSKEQKGSRD
jgi:protein-S-isoprenylcysteine O-methyltransferase Ste14